MRNTVNEIDESENEYWENVGTDIHVLFPKVSFNCLCLFENKISEVVCSVPRPAVARFTPKLMYRVHIRTERKRLVGI